MYRIVAQQFPNNETRVTMSSVSGGRDPFDDEPAPHECTTVDFPLLERLSLQGEAEKVSSDPLSLVPNSKTQRSRAGYGELPVKPTRFGMNAKRSLIRSGGALEKTAPTDETLFLTGTLPGSTEDSFRAIAAYASYIVNGLKAWVSNYAPQKLDFYCWELQKRGALHLHYAVWIPDDKCRAHILESFRGWWIQILHRVGEMASVDMFRKNSGKTWLDDESKVRAVAEVCRKSVARYLAKYLSKSAAPKRGSSRAFSPARWWGVSRPLKALTDSMTLTCEVITSGYHAVRSMWEEIRSVSDSSESVTYSYRHKVGEGSTVIMFTKEDPDREQLWQEINSLQTRKMESLIGRSETPSMVLKRVKTKQVKWLQQSLTSLSPSYQGLSEALSQNLSWTWRIMPSTSLAPLPLLLAWAARLSDIRSMCQFTPVLTSSMDREIQSWLDDLEWAIEEIAKNGWS